MFSALQRQPIDDSFLPMGKEAKVRDAKCHVHKDTEWEYQAGLCAPNRSVAIIVLSQCEFTANVNEYMCI